jgi:hypothetical protein
MILIPIPIMPGYDIFPNHRIVNFLRHAVEGNGCSPNVEVYFNANFMKIYKVLFLTSMALATVIRWQYQCLATPFPPLDPCYNPEKKKSDTLRLTIRLPKLIQNQQ